MRIPVFRRAAVAAVAAAALISPIALAPPSTAASPEASVERACDIPEPGQFACFAMRRTDVRATKGVLRSTAPEGLSPADLRSAYGLPADGGKGATIAVIAAQDNPRAEADLAVYRKQFGLPECTTASGCLTKVDQNGGTDYPVARAGWAAEISLDLQMVSAVAPKARIVLVEAATPNFDDLGAAVNQAVAQGAQFISNSYGTGYSPAAGSGEDPALTSWMDAYYDHPGVTVVASSGDSGYGVSYPASSQYVTAVGGTSLVKDDSARGWSEKAWAGSGSGCSLYSAKPGAQKDGACAKRTVADVSAVADPATGVAVYNAYKADGWSVYGGTSASAPLITGVYANAGKPLSGTYPNSYPYAKPGALNDITEGTNGSCFSTQAALCKAGVGYDGPTGLGTPKGPDAFRAGPHGEITGKVVDGRGRPVAGAEVHAGGNRATTDVEGGYSLVVPPGAYEVSVAAFGYRTTTPVTVKAVEDTATTHDARLRSVPHRTVEGTVKDDSGHDWPLYAEITVDGVPGGPVYSDARSGRFTVDLPEDADYTLRAKPVYPGYQESERKVTVAGRDIKADLPVKVDADKCYAPGYGPTDHGVREGFESGVKPDGWTVTNANSAGGGWEFTSDRLNQTTDGGGFAVVDSRKLGSGKTQDTYLTTPAVDMRDIKAPKLAFDTYFLGLLGSKASADVSVDGGTTWTTLWESGQNVLGKHLSFDLPQAKGAQDVRARFHYTGSWAQWWELDDVQLGQTTCDPRPGGLLVGEVTDATTHDALPAATVSVKGGANASGTTAALPDPAAAGAFYWLFTKETGDQHLAAAAYRHTDAEPALDVAAGDVTRKDIALKSGRIDMDGKRLDATLTPGDSDTSYVTVKNTGTATATVRLGVDSDGYTPPAGTSDETATRRVEADVTTGPQAATALKMSEEAREDTQRDMDEDAATPAGGWTPVADYPTKVSGNIVDSHEGILYSGLGYTGPVTLNTNAFYAYDPADRTWQEREFPQDARESAAHGFVDGKLYVTGGWGIGSSKGDRKTEVYDPDTDTWTTATAAPAPYGGSGSAVLGGKLYVIGGCDETGCGKKDTWTYEPSSGAWDKVADYPEPIAWESCGALSGSVYCAGGTGPGGATAHAYRYDAKADTWTPVAGLPGAVWGSAYATGGGRLLVQNGVMSGAVTNQGWAYDPESDHWSALPNSPQASYRYGAATGMYTVGGSMSATRPLAATLLLPGYDRVDTTAGWLTLDHETLTLEPGEQVKVRARFSAGFAAPVAGTYGATVYLTTDTPFSAPKLTATLTVEKSGS
ncbi:carboxypeptidase regulatory-like domain-containing protein [Streptomyces sp. NBC_00063]|uniref:carboxypeptidase regulatory-like domain-containing protein n=1 Tax=Streptomyces sp. NBC_00063 TaxID=2975638 RepID=UPI003D7594E2